MLTVISMSERSDRREDAVAVTQMSRAGHGLVAAHGDGTAAWHLGPPAAPTAFAEPISATGAARRGCAARSVPAQAGPATAAPAELRQRRAAAPARAQRWLGSPRELLSTVSERRSDPALSVRRGDAGGAGPGRAQEPPSLPALPRDVLPARRLSGVLGCCAGAARAEAERAGLRGQGGREASGGNSGHVCGGRGVAGRGAAPGPAAAWV